MHETFQYDIDEDKDEVLLTVHSKFRTYCEPRKNIGFERYQFWCRNQSEGDPVDQWVIDLRMHENGRVPLPNEIKNGDERDRLNMSLR